MSQTSSEIVSMASNLPQPLNIPDILQITFALLDRQSLSACVQVNSLWADAATDILWQDPPISALVSLIPSGRAQTYANKLATIRNPYGSLKERNNIEPLQALQHLLFPRLREIYWLGADVTCMERLLHYLQPSLRKFSLSLSSLRYLDEPSSGHDEAFNSMLTGLTTHCCFLQEIFFSLDSLNGVRLLRFLEKASSLTSVQLVDSGAIEDEVIQHLAARPNLKRLSIDSIISGERAALIEANTVFPFADLQYFEGWVEKDSIIRLGRHMQKLEVLRIDLLDVLDVPSDLLSVIARLSNLRTLEIRFHAVGSAISTQDLIPLAKGCQKLKKLSLKGYNESNEGWIEISFLKWSDIREVDIFDFSYLLPDLEHLEIDIRGEITNLSLRYLGQNCSRLRTCDLRACVLDVSKYLENFHSDESTGLNLSGQTNFRKSSPIVRQSLDPWPSKKTGATQPWFPELKFLRIQGLVNYEHVPIPKMLSCLCSRFPQLERFTTLSDHDVDEELLEAFEYSVSERKRAIKTS